MATSVSGKSSTARLQQMLFAYDRGHGLLASSSGIPKTLASKVLGDTDWDPRVSVGIDGYLSGRPVRDEKSYVVMKTWRAPEMPRPGCVWTHVLVLSEADLSRIPDLQVLAGLMKRPDNKSDFSQYKTEIGVEAPFRSKHSVKTDEMLVRNLVELVYAGIYHRDQANRFDRAEQAMLALWSQQWPALRRRFSFRTAQLSRTKQSRPSGYEVEFSDSQPSQAFRQKEWWDEVAHLITHDIMASGTTSFRRFLWRYGADTSGSKEDLLLLARIFRQLVAVQDGQQNAAALAVGIGDAFPDYHNALLLKSDLTNPTNTNYSLLPEFDQLDIALGILSSRHASSFPELGGVHRDPIAQWLTNRPAELVNVLSALAGDQSDFASSIFGHVAAANDPEFLWRLLEASETAFVRCLGGSVKFLDDDRVEKLSDQGLVQIFAEIDTDSAKALGNLVPRLLSRDKEILVSTVYETAPKQVTS